MSWITFNHVQFIGDDTWGRLKYNSGKLPSIGVTVADILNSIGVITKSDSVLKQLWLHIAASNLLNLSIYPRIIIYTMHTHKPFASVVVQDEIHIIYTHRRFNRRFYGRSQQGARSWISNIVNRNWSLLRRISDTREYQICPSFPLPLSLNPIYNKIRQILHLSPSIKLIVQYSLNVISSREYSRYRRNRS